MFENKTVPLTKKVPFAKKKRFRLRKQYLFLKSGGILAPIWSHFFQQKKVVPPYQNGTVLFGNSAILLKVVLFWFL